MPLTRPLINNLNTNVEVFNDTITVLHGNASVANADIGLLMNRAGGLVANVALYWNESSQSFITAYTSSDGVSYSNIAVTSYANLTVGNIINYGNFTSNGTVISNTVNAATICNTGAVHTGSTGTFTSWANVTGTATSTSTTTGALVVAGGVGVAGNIYVGGIYIGAGGTNGLYWSANNSAVSTGGGGTFAGGQLTSSIYPNGNLTLNVGTSSAFWANTYTGNLIISNGIQWANGAVFSSGTGSGSVNPAIYLGKTIATTATTLIDTLPTTGNTSVSWCTTSTDSVNNQYKVSTINSINNGTTVNYAEYGVVLSNVGTTVATFTSNITSGNINLYAVGNSSSVTVTFERTVLGSATASGYLNAGATGPAGTIANATNIAITNDTTTATTVYPTWVTTTTGNLPAKTSSTKLSFVPSTGTLSATKFAGDGSALTGIVAGATITPTTSNSTYYLVGTTLTSGNLTTASISTTSPVSYNASTGTLSSSAHGLNGSTSGSVTLNTVAVAGTNTATFPAATGTVMVSGNMPAFSAYLLADQSMTANTFTKVTINTKEFDTNSNFNTSTYRFTPTVAGYYEVNSAVYPASTVTGIYCGIYKNGSAFKAAWGTTASAAVSVLIYMNGSTDYLELYTYLQGATPSLLGNSNLTFFQACLVRSA